jgi:hypothetical protein
VKLRAGLLVFVNMLLACAAPESNPAERCNAELRCGEPLVCYRGYCVDPDADEDGEPPDVTLVDAGSLPERSDAGARPARPATPTDASSYAATLDDASAPVFADVPGTSAPVVLPTPVTVVPVTDPAPTQPPPVATAPVAATPVVPTPTPVACLVECAQGASKDACKECFEHSYGDKPEELCGEKKIKTNMVTVCALICGINKWSVSCHASGGPSKP